MMSSSRFCKDSFELIFLICLASTVTFFVIIGNGFILWKLRPLLLSSNRKTRHNLRANFDILLSYLAAFDLLAAITMIPRIYNEAKCYTAWPFGRIGCKIILPVYDISLNISVCILVIISVERYRSITKPFKKVQTRRIIHLSVLISIIMSFAVYFERFITADEIDGSCSHHISPSLLNISPLFVWLSRDIVLLSVFTTTSVIIHRFLSSIQHKKTASTKRKKEHSWKVFRLLFSMQIVFTIDRKSVV